MGKYDFDTIIDRSKSEDIKVNLKAEFGREDLIPLWVADMDFATPEPVLKALLKKLEHPILGYPSRLIGLPPMSLIILTILGLLLRSTSVWSARKSTPKRLS